MSEAEKNKNRRRVKSHNSKTSDCPLYEHQKRGGKEEGNTRKKGKGYGWRCGDVKVTRRPGFSPPRRIQTGMWWRETSLTASKAILVRGLSWKQTAEDG